MPWMTYVWNTHVPGSAPVWCVSSLWDSGRPLAGTGRIWTRANLWPDVTRMFIKRSYRDWVPWTLGTWTQICIVSNRHKINNLKLDMHHECKYNIRRNYGIHYRNSMHFWCSHMMMMYENNVEHCFNVVWFFNQSASQTSQSINNQSIGGCVSRSFHQSVGQCDKCFVFWNDRLTDWPTDRPIDPSPHLWVMWFKFLHVMPALGTGGVDNTKANSLRHCACDADQA